VLRTFWIAVFLAALLTKCGSIKSQSNPDVAANKQAITEKRRCDFAEFKPMKFGANHHSPMVSIPKPGYPSEARAQGIHGTVTVLLLVKTRTGGVEQVCALEGDELLVAAAKEAGLRVRFDPYSSSIQERFSYAEEIVTYQFVAP
jgi:hypothetical protein